MALHKKFIRKLAELRESPLHRILGDDGLNMFVWENGQCKMNFTSLDEIDDILNTIDFLKDEGYITIESVDWHIVPELGNPFKQLNENEVYHLFYTQNEFVKYYGMYLRVKRPIFGFIKDGFKTARSRKERRDFWLPIGVAILSSVLTAFLTTWLSCSY